MASVGVIVHRQRPDAVRSARSAADWLKERGHEVRIVREEAEELDLEECGCDAEKLAAGLDLAVSLGGDGTMLRTVELVAREDVPVLGVNAGRLGYLTEIEPGELLASLDRFFKGQFAIEERMTLAVGVESPSGSAPSGTFFALN